MSNAPAFTKRLNDFVKLSQVKTVVQAGDAKLGGVFKKAKIFDLPASKKGKHLERLCADNGLTDIDLLCIHMPGKETAILQDAGDTLPTTKAVRLVIKTDESKSAQISEDRIERLMREHGLTCVLNTMDEAVSDKLYIRDDLVWPKAKTLPHTPRVTVLLAGWNSAKYLREGMDSILNQTFKDFEFLIINDGSTDKTAQVVASYHDKRIRFIDRRQNWRLTRSLNQGIQYARGEFLARQDDDDLSVRTRLAKEVAFLDQHPNVGMVGSNYTITDAKRKKIVTTNVFTHPHDLKLTQITCNQFGHGSVMMRKTVLDQCKGYDAEVGHVEDYDLWTRISRITGIANIEEPLYLYLSNPKGITLQNHERQINQAFTVRDRAFKHFLKHRREYRLYFYKPSGHHYRQRKATLLRDLAYLYNRNRRPLNALWLLGLALLLDPKNRRTYRCIQYTLYKPRFDRWEYEFL